MKFHGVEMKGDFIVEKLPTTPTWSSDDEGRLIYVNDENILKQGTDSAWVDVGSGSSSSGNTYYTLPESNGDILYDDCSNISLWTDSDQGTGISTQVTQDDKSAFKLDTGSTSGGVAWRKYITSTFPDIIYITLRMNNTSLGDTGDPDDFQLLIYVSSTQLIQFSFNSTGFRTFNGSGWNTVESGISVNQNVWTDWTLIINRTNKKLTIYQDGVKIKENIEWEYWTGSGLTTCYSFQQQGTDATNRITYVDQVKVGSAFTKVSQNDLAGMTKFGINNTPYTPAGYVAGGNTGGYVSTIDKLTFSNDNCGVITSHLSSTKTYSTGFNSSTSGYSAGGTSTGVFFSIIDKLIFSNDNCNSITSHLSSSRYSPAGFNSSSAGYIAGGRESGGRVSTIDTFTFTNDNCNNISSTLSIARDYPVGFNSSSAGYSCGGSTGGTPHVSTIDKLTFSNDNCNNITSHLSSSRCDMSGFNSSSSGYNVGGTVNGPKLSTIDKLTFNNDNNSSINSGLSYIVVLSAGFNSTTSGYAAGGDTGSLVTTINKLTFSDDSVSVLTSGLSTTRTGSAGFNTL